jgi:hypothetical protein
MHFCRDDAAPIHRQMLEFHRYMRVLAVTAAAMVTASCTVRHTKTFDDLADSLISAAVAARTSQGVESDLRYGAQGEWALVVVGRDGFDAREAVSQGLSEAHAARITRLVTSLQGDQYLVGITPHAVSYVEVAEETCALGGQRAVVANGERWLGFTIKSRRDDVPALTDFRLLDGPRAP